jgi:hypothetical protein
MFKYSLPNLIKAYNDNKDLIIAYQTGKSIEGYAYPVDFGANANDDQSGKVAGLAIGVFITILVISLLVWIWGLILMIMYWKKLHGWAKAIGIICLLIGFPLATVIVGYVGQK